MEKDLIDLTQLKKSEILAMLDLAGDIKKHPLYYRNHVFDKTLLMIFEKPSLRTRVSFEVGMTQMGGHAIYYDLSTSPMGKKESVADTAKTASRYVDIIMARLFSHENLKTLAINSTVPVINALTDFSHPCQILSDFLTIREHKSKLSGLKLAYFGDGNNNVTHSLLFGCSILGIDVSIACPKGSEYEPLPVVVQKSKMLAEHSGSKIEIVNTAKTAIENADVVYTDTWMSYHIPDDKKVERVRVFSPYCVNRDLMALAKNDAIFMHCLPALRDMEVSSDIIDGPQSIVFDQAENRLHLQKALMLKLLNLG